MKGGGSKLEGGIKTYGGYQNLRGGGGGYQNLRGVSKPEGGGGVSKPEGGIKT